MKIKLLTTTLFMIIVSNVTFCQIELLEEGISHSQKGKYEKAEVIFKSIEPSNKLKQVRIDIARGYNFSWWKKYNNAIYIFNNVLQKEPENIEANLGLAYTYLWQKDNQNAKKQFKKVLSIEDNNEEAKKQLDALKNFNKKFDFDAWYGFTFSDDKDQNGLRRLDLKYQPNAKNLLYIYYDDALILDNSTLSTIERTAPIVGAGVKHDWSKKWFSTLGAGRRFLSNSDDQHLINIENGYFFSPKLLGKFFTQYDFRQDDELLTIAGFIDYELIKKVRVELGFFHSENLTFKDIFNERVLLASKTKINNIELLGAVYYDMFNTPDTSLKQFGGGFGLITFPVVKNLRGKFFVNHDKGFNNKVTIVSIGINQKF